MPCRGSVDEADRCRCHFPIKAVTLGTKKRRPFRGDVLRDRLNDLALMLSVALRGFAIAATCWDAVTMANGSFGVFFVGED